MTSSPPPTDNIGNTGYTGAASAPRGRSRLALIALVLALIPVLVSFVLLFAVQLRFDANLISAYSIVSTLGMIVSGLSASAALIVGIIAAKRDQDRLWPGVAIGLSTATLIGLLISIITIVVIQFNAAMVYAGMS